MSDWFKYMNSGLKFLVMMVMATTCGLFIYVNFFQSTDIKDASYFEASLEDKAVDEGDTVTATIKMVKNNPVLGYELWLTDKVVLVGSNGSGYEAGDTIKFEVVGGQENMGVWMITYKILNGGL